MESNQSGGIVFDIERFSTHDGPGIRTVVFLKGCPLRCQWCASPESQLAAPQMGFLAEVCAGCGRCIKTCPNGAFFLTEHQPDFADCQNCFHCVKTCLYDARVVYGTRMRVEEVVKKVQEDTLFYRKSNGGVTLSGGEVCMQPDFAAAILKNCQELGIHTAIETCGYARWEHFSKVIRHVDYLMFDLKHMDSTVHQKYTGVPNTLILENAVRASDMVGELIVRMPVIPGVNDSLENVHKMGIFVKENMPKVNRIDLLPYHSIGESKGRNIGRKYPFSAPYEISKEKLDSLSAVLKEKGFLVKIER